MAPSTYHVHLSGVEETFTGHVTPAPARQPGVPTLCHVRLGVHPTYRVFAFYDAPSPTLNDLFAAAKERFPPGALDSKEGRKAYLVEDGGRSFTELETEREWELVGWKRAMQVYEGARMAGGWEAATFHLGPLRPASFDPSAHFDSHPFLVHSQPSSLQHHTHVAHHHPHAVASPVEKHDAPGAAGKHETGGTAAAKEEGKQEK
ncbi:hypothetical protein JCM10213_001315 [Rhodosporidiobolus nylandii]